MAAYYLWFRLNYNLSVIPESEGYAPPSALAPMHPYHWTVVVDVRGRVVVRDRDHVLATGTWENDWDVVDPKTRMPLVPTTEQWVFIAEHLRAMIASPRCKQHPATPAMIDDGTVDEPAPPVVHHAHPAPSPRPPPRVEPAAAPPPPVVVMVAGVVVYYAFLKPH